MKRSGIRPLALALAAVFFLALSPFAPREGPVRLLKIPKGQEAVLEVLARFKMDIRQELESSVLVMADRDDLRILGKNGIRFSILCRDAAGKTFFLLPVSFPEVFDDLRSVGRMALVEPATVLFWRDSGDPFEVLPPDLPRKPLAGSPISPALRVAKPSGLERLAQDDKDPLIEMIIAQVSGANLRALVESLQDFGTRYATTFNCEAAGQAIFTYFESLGLDVRFQPFGFGAAFESRNVIAEKVGERYPEDILVLCGHYDSTSPASSRMTLAPGADDNASGTAAVMEAARILVNQPFDFTVRFIAFSAEEWGLYGSRAYASSLRNTDERIIGVINLDMIGYADVMPEDLEIIVNANSEWMARRLERAASTYPGLSCRTVVNASFTYSDHASFWDQGYPALLAIEDEPLRNPYYHRITDAVDTLNFDFFSDSTRAALALLTELGQPVKDGYPEPPTGVDVEQQLYWSLFSSLRNVRLSWTASPGVSGYNIYRAAVSHLDYEKLNTSLVTSTFYTDRNVSETSFGYYVVTSVNPSGMESNYSREIEVLPPWTSGVTPAVRNSLILRVGAGR